MKIVFTFVGGSLDDSIVAGDSDARMPEGQLDPATHYYGLCQEAKVGCQFPVSISNGVETYKVRKRLEKSNVVMVLASFVAKAGVQTSST
jgi:hypothetical protein